MPHFSDCACEYSGQWGAMVADAALHDDFCKTAHRLIAHKREYQAIAAQAHVPWPLIALIHFRESDADFTTHLYNGDPLNARTVHVPQGQPPLPAKPPFTFEQSALGAISYDHMNDIADSEWCIEQIAFHLEHYNGWGYHNRSLPSAYLWAGTNIYRGGKFDRDGHFDGTMRDRQLGCMPLLAAMIAQDNSIEIPCSGGVKPRPDGNGAGVSISSLVAAHDYGFGDESDAVRTIQLALAKLGYPLRGTGYFGQATDTAVTDFQKRMHLEVDGIVGPETAKALDGCLSKAGAPITGAVASSPTGRSLWLTEALRFIGTKEAPGAADNPMIIEWADELGGEIEQEYKHDSVPWCALFVNYALMRAGEKGTGTLWALDFAKWGQPLDGPAVGAIVSMTRKGGGHVAIVLGKDAQGNLVCIGGNQNDQVCIRSFPQERPMVAYRWPAHTQLPDKTGLQALPIVRSDGGVVTKET
jgi:uncharacterized protein (TIGR02594 family)